MTMAKKTYGYKKVFTETGTAILKLQIMGRRTEPSRDRVDKGKRRCSQAKVVKVWHSVQCHYHPNADSNSHNAFRIVKTYYVNPRSVKGMYSSHSPSFKYSLGKIVRPRNGFDNNLDNVCSRGIHFFDTYAEAVAYPL